MEDGDRALTLIRDEIIEDCNQYVPVQGSEKHNGGGGSLQNSAFIHSDQEAKDGELVVRWDAPYAQYQHGGLVMHGTPTNRSYGPQHLKYTSAAAKEEWTKYAAERHGEQWSEMLDKVL